MHRIVFTVLFAGLLAAIPGSAPAAWMEARTNHFIVYSDDQATNVRSLATKLERFDMALRKLHSLPDQPSDRVNPVTVDVVPGVMAVQKLCSSGRDAKSGCAYVYGFYNGSAEGSVAYMPRRAGTGQFDLNALTVLLHEYSHHMLEANYSVAYPAWFSEGYAEFNATAGFEQNGDISFGRPALYRFYDLLSGDRLPAAKLLATDGVKLSPDIRAVLYAKGWLLTHYLTFDPSRTGQLQAYLNAISKGTPSLDAGKAAFGDLSKLDRNLDGYLHSGKMAYARVPVPALKDDAIILRTLTPGEAAMMPVRLRSSRGSDPATSRLVAADARRRAASFPADAGAQTVLAEAEYDAGDDDAAEAAADRALAVAPDDRRAMMYKGRVRIRRAQKAKVRDPAVWREARSWFVKANRDEPDDAAPLYLFYQSFLAEGVPATPNAVTGLERAFHLAPQDDDLRFMLARQCILDGRLPEARSILIKLAVDPHAEADNPASRLIARIDRADSKGIAEELRVTEALPSAR